MGENKLRIGGLIEAGRYVPEEDNPVYYIRFFLPRRDFMVGFWPGKGPFSLFRVRNHRNVYWWPRGSYQLDVYRFSFGRLPK